MSRTMVVLLALLCLAGTAIAEVKDQAANGFTIATTFTVKGAPDDVYRKITNVADWWSSAHTYSGDARNLTLDAKAGGCWCEKLPKANGSVEHMRVATAWPGTLLVLTGGLGPLQQMGVSGAMTFKLSPADGGTKIEFNYAVAGYAPPGMAALAPVVDRVLMDGLARLRSYVETGTVGGSTK